MPAICHKNENIFTITSPYLTKYWHSGHNRLNHNLIAITWFTLHVSPRPIYRPPPVMMVHAGLLVLRKLFNCQDSLGGQSFFLRLQAKIKGLFCAVTRISIHAAVQFNNHWLHLDSSKDCVDFKPKVQVHNTITHAYTVHSTVHKFWGQKARKKIQSPKH